MSQAEPRQLFAKLRQEIVCNEAYHAGQDVQDEAKSRLRIERTGGALAPKVYGCLSLQLCEMCCSNRIVLTCRAMKTVLALMAKVITAMRGHMTRSECRISFYKESEGGARVPF